MADTKICRKCGIEKPLSEFQTAGNRWHPDLQTRKKTCKVCCNPSLANLVVVQSYHGPVVTLIDARAAGLTRYFPAEPCSRGHIAERMVSNRICVVCLSGKTEVRHARVAPRRNAARVAKRADNLDEARSKGRERYAKDPGGEAAKMRAYRAENPETVKATQKRAYDKDPAARVAASIEWQRKNPVKRAAQSKRHREIHGLEMYVVQRKWVRANPDKRKAAEARFRKANPEKPALDGRRRRAQKHGAAGSHTLADVAIIRIAQGDLCANPMCYVSLAGKGHVDHNIPLSCGGSDSPENLHILCDSKAQKLSGRPYRASCNQSKGVRTNDEFLLWFAHEYGLKWPPETSREAAE